MSTAKKILFISGSATCGKTLMMKIRQLKYAKGQDKVLLHEELLGRSLE